MKKQRCDDCGAVLDPWDPVYRWPEGNGVQYLCACCVESRIDEMTARDMALALGVTELSLSDLAP